ncbi:uncharacterized protein LOC142028824 isoform X3 [Buteo buteo]|uniref:uncharacterized protein LOC142028824 isoform X3 n=1 Tax=Buteo buteo TaxID=30397 RepID=UPI003EC03747
MPLPAAASGSRGLSLPGLPLLVAQEHRGTGGALAGCGRELLKLERPEKDVEDQCVPLKNILMWRGKMCAPERWRRGAERRKEVRSKERSGPSAPEVSRARWHTQPQRSCAAGHRGV